MTITVDLFLMESELDDSQQQTLGSVNKENFMSKLYAVLNYYVQLGQGRGGDLRWMID